MPSVPRGLALLTGSGGRPELLVSLSSPVELASYALTDSGTIVRHGAWKLRRALSQITAVDLDRDGVAEVLGLDEGDPAIVVLRRRSAGIEQVRLPLDAPTEKFLVADINNDERMDLLLFGRNAAGMSVLRGEAGGTFRSPVPLFEDVSISDAAVTDLNGDGIADVFLLNWLSNSLEVFFGIGNFVFSAQVTIALGGEPSAIALTPASRSRTVEVAITLADAPSVAIIRGNGAGEFSRRGTIPLPGLPSGLQFALLNDDQIPDLLIALSSGMMTAFGRKDGTFGSPQVHGIRAEPGLWKARDLNGNRRTDLVFVQQGGQRLGVALDGAATRRRFSPGAYVTGPEPAGITIADVTRDGLADLVVANQGSSTVSVLVNRLTGQLEPHRQSPVSEAPGQIRDIIPSSGPWTTILTAHRKAERVSVARLSPDGFASGFFAIPTGSDPRILDGTETSPDTGMRILVQNLEPGRSSVTFSLFEQISGATFIERSYKAGSQEAGRWSSIADFGKEGERDVIVLVRLKNGDSSQIARARTGEGLALSAVEPVVTFPDSGAGSRALLTGDVNGDGFPDLLIARSGTSPSLGVALSGAETGVPGPFRWIPHVRIDSPQLAVLIDADQDGNMDLVYYDSARKSVLTLFGKGGGEFSAPRAVATVSSLGGLAVGPLGRSGMNDLALTDPDNGYVRIIYDPF